MNSGEIDKRTLVLDVEWTSPEDSEPSGDEDDEDEGMLDFHGNDGDDEDEEEEEDEEESGDEEEDEDESETELPPPPVKRKRPTESSMGSVAPPKKRVTFDLQKPTKGAGPPSGLTLPKSGLKTTMLTSRKRRKSLDKRAF